jgi:hypothetical protein
MYTHFIAIFLNLQGIFRNQLSSALYYALIIGHKPFNNHSGPQVPGRAATPQRWSERRDHSPAHAESNLAAQKDMSRIDT